MKLKINFFGVPSFWSEDTESSRHPKITCSFDLILVHIQEQGEYQA
jgi:hypothetical protein